MQWPQVYLKQLWKIQPEPEPEAVEATDVDQTETD